MDGMTGTTASVVDALTETVRAALQRAYDAGRRDSVAALVSAASEVSQPARVSGRTGPRILAPAGGSDIGPRSDQIVNYLRLHGETSCALIAAALGITWANANALLRRLAVSGHVQRVRAGVYAIAEAEGRS